MKHTKATKKKGFTLLFAVLLSALVLAVGASVINIAMKQVILSGVGRESQFAFYAANTGIECALYWDLADRGVFATSSLSAPLSDEVVADISCAGGYNLFDETEGNLTVTEGVPAESSAITNFKIEFEPPIQYCAIVQVTKEKKEDDMTYTKIESRGYNTCDEANPRRTERGLILSY